MKKIGLEKPLLTRKKVTAETVGSVRTGRSDWLLLDLGGGMLESKAQRRDPFRTRRKRRNVERKEMRHEAISPAPTLGIAFEVKRKPISGSLERHHRPTRLKRLKIRASGRWAQFLIVKFSLTRDRGGMNQVMSFSRNSSYLISIP